MPRLRKPAIDLSQKPGNLTQELYDMMQSGELQAFTDPESLAQHALALANKYRGHGLSTEHYNRFVLTVNKCKDDLVRLRSYLTGYFMKGIGLGAEPTRYGGRYESIEAIADIISESTTKVVLSEEKLAMLNEIHAVEFPPNFTVATLPWKGQIIRRGFDNVIDAKAHLQECTLNESNVAGAMYDSKGNIISTFLVHPNQ